MNEKIFFKELSFILNGLCFRVHNELGRFCRERQYADRLEQLFRTEGLKYQREVDLLKIRKESPTGNRADFVIESKIVIDLKAKPIITKDDYLQMQRYLWSSGLKLGLIVNFRSRYLKPKRVINTRMHS